MSADLERAFNESIRQSNAIAGNVTMPESAVRRMSQEELDAFKSLSTGFGDAEYLRNFSDDFIQIVKRDGNLSGVLNHRTDSLSRGLAGKYRGKLVFISTRCIDIDTYRHSTTPRRASFAETREEMLAAQDAKTHLVPNSLFCHKYMRDLQREADNVANRLSRAHMEDIPEIISQHPELGSDTNPFLRVMVGYVINVDELSLTNDVYGDWFGFLFRRMVREEDKGLNIWTPKKAMHARGPMRHPLCMMDKATIARGWHGTDSASYIEAVTVKMHPQTTRHRKVYIVRNNAIREQKIELIDESSDLKEGIYITISENGGIPTEAFHTLDTLEKHNIFYFRDEAEKRLTIESREAQSIEKETEARNEAARVKTEEMKATTHKNETSVKTDVLRFCAQVLATVVAVTTAVVGLIRLFTSSRLAAGAWSRAAF